MENHDARHRDTITTTRRDDTDPPRNAFDTRDDAETKGDKKPADENKSEGNDAAKNKKPWYRRPLLVGVLMLVVIVGAVGGALWWRHSRKYQSTDDAAIDVVAQRVSPEIAGRVLRVLVDDNQDVAVGTVLVELDPADFRNRLDQARAAEAQAAAQIAEAEAQAAVADAQREQAKGNQGVVEANATNAASELRRFQDLRADTAGAVSQQQLDRATAAANSAAAQLRAAQKGVVAADAQAVHAARQIDAARAAARSAASQVAQAELMLSYAQVKARVAGRIARKTVSPGNYVEPGTDLMAVVPSEVYVTANFKETQLTQLRPGQPVKVEVDPYPDLELTGRVASVQPATGQVFDILPSQNAAGNWVKVVQRVPVKISLDKLPDDPDLRLSPGMSVTVTVTVQ
jgi:membrane fusion protein (multidrug efflux system)